VPHGKVTWQIDRNVNTTNVCIANCKFCNFFRSPGHEDAYITDIETYKKKIEETFPLWRRPAFITRRPPPRSGLQFYTDLFRELKQLYPKLKLHSLGPAGNCARSQIGNMSHYDVLKAMKEAGLDSLPGAGAEILNDRVRRLISKGKCGGKEWLDVMRAAHQLKPAFICHHDVWPYRNH
jgi:cyclic dehypoxanthinyl futalosine synthase